MVLTRKRLLLIGFLLILLIGIPVTLYVVQQQQEIRSRASASSTLYFQPATTEASPLVKKVGENFSLDLYANPGTNLISIFRIEILYDPAKLATASTSGTPAFVENKDIIGTVMFGPVYTPGKISMTLTTGFDPTAVLDTVNKIGTLTLVPLAETAGVVTKVSYGPNSLVASGGEDAQGAENVLSATNPAFITILGSGPIVTPSASVTAIPTLTPTLTLAPTQTPTPVVVTDPPGATGPAGPEGPQGPAGADAPTPEITLATTETATATPTLESNSVEEVPTATPTMDPSGPGDTVLGFGFVVAVLTIIGGILFFAL